jgi:hypothetical protein
LEIRQILEISPRRKTVGNITIVLVLAIALLAVLAAAGAVSYLYTMNNSRTQKTTEPCFDENDLCDIPNDDNPRRRFDSRRGAE